MGKFMDRLRPQPQSYLPPAPPVPERKESDQTGTYISEGTREIMVKIFDNGKPEDLVLALGALEMAKDIVKQTIMGWHMREKKTHAILVPKGNGHA